MANFQVKDFTSGLAVKIRAFLVNTDENVSVHSLVDTANGEILGTKTQARSTSTDTTATSVMEVLKQISFSIQAFVTTFGAAWTRGVGAADSNTQRISVATDSQTAQVADNADGVAASASLLNIPVVARLMGWNGSTYDRLQVDATTKGMKSAGDIAHDAVDAGAPQKIGGKATAGLSGETLVAAGDRTQFYGELDGASIARNACSLGDLVDGTNSNTDGTSTQVIAAAGAGIKQYLTRVSLSNTHASTSVMVALKSGTTTKWRCNVPPGGRELAFDPPLKPNAANEAWNFDPDAAVTTIECSMNGFKSKV
jgi:hypothetical protein